jgi:hypothetical protein
MRRFTMTAAGPAGAVAFVGVAASFRDTSIGSDPRLQLFAIP